MESQRIAEQLKEAGGEVAKLRLLRDNLKLTEVKLKATQYDGDVSIVRPCNYNFDEDACMQSTKKELATAQEEVRTLTISKDKAVEDLSNSQKQLETKDMVSTNQQLCV